MRRPPLLLLAATLLASALAPARAPAHGAAQDAAAPITVAAGGLANPRGFTWDADGALVVAEAGTGGETAATEDVPPPTGPYRGGPTARVSRVDAAGCPATVADGLPSAVSAGGEPIGASDVVLLGDRLIALVAGGGSAHGNPDQPAGLYGLAADGATLLVDLGAWLRDNPVATAPRPAPDSEGDWYGMVAAPDGVAVLVVERNGEQILRVTPDGEITRVVDLSAEDGVPTALAVDRDGALHVGHLTASPYTAGGAYVLKVAADGATERVWTGLTMVTGLAFGPDGALYATELSSAPDQPPFFVPGTGRVVRQTGPDTSEEVVTQLDLPTTTRFGPDGALYVSLPAVGSDNGSGIVVRADLSGGQPLAAQDADLTPPACGAGTTIDPGAIQVEIFDFGFDETQLTVTVGTTVTWTNVGAVDHTTVHFAGGGKTWDSDIMAPGAAYSFTFADIGTYAYVCGLHPAMQGTIDVVPTGP